MTETIDHLIHARFDTVANPLDDGDWGDVLARADRAAPARHRRRPSLRLATAAAAAVLTATGTAVAFGWPGAVVDFFNAPRAPESVRTFFAAHHTAIPGGVSPYTKLGEAHEVMTATFDADNLPAKNPTVHTLYVAPRDGGGFCYLWTEYGGGCADPESAAKAETDPAARALGVEWLEKDYAGFVDGWVRADAKTVEAQFADGTTAPIPVTWVSEPIGAGFFAYVVPPAHQIGDDALASVVALDGNGNVVGQQTFAAANALDEDVVQTLPDGTKVSLPRRAQAAHAKEVVSFRTASGSHAYLWVMPRTGGGVCFVYGTGANGGQGCTSPSWLARLPVVNGGGSDGVYFAQVKPNVAALELHFRGGSSERLTPTDGFVLHDIGQNGRLVGVVGLDRNGTPIYRSGAAGGGG
jgi:hypothetical protein